MGYYLKLMQILEAASSANRKIHGEIRGTGDDLTLAIVEEWPQYKKRRTLGTAPFEPGHMDEAAEDVARQMTLDGKLPPGMDYEG